MADKMDTSNEQVQHTGKNPRGRGEPRSEQPGQQMTPGGSTPGGQSPPAKKPTAVPGTPPTPAGRAENEVPPHDAPPSAMSAMASAYGVSLGDVEGARSTNSGASTHRVMQASTPNASTRVQDARHALRGTSALAAHPPDHSAQHTLRTRTQEPCPKMRPCRPTRRYHA